nr:uncharacterized protein LOC114819434 isoform X2 [Malus domestica]
MVSSLPKEIVHDILLRLPPKALMRCTSVSKPWNSMIKSPSFIRTKAFVNWAVHWLAWRCLNDGRYQNFILAIDVDGDGNSVAMFTTTRGRNCPEDFLDIWVMKEYGIEDSWAKLITLSPPDPERRVPYKPLCFRNNGEVVS